MKFFERYEGWFHAIGWAVFLNLPLLTLPDFLLNRQDLISIGMAQLLTGGLMITFFYVNLHQLTPALLLHQRTRRFALLVGVMLVSVVVLKVLCFYVFPPSAMHPDAPPPSPPDGTVPPGRPVGPGPHSPCPGC